MKHRKVIDGKQLPAKLPITFTAMMWLLLDHLQPFGWVQGMIWTLVAIVWILSIFAVWTQDSIEIKFP